ICALAERHEVVNVSGRSRQDTEAAAAMLRARGIRLATASVDPEFGRLAARAKLRKVLRLASGRSSLVPRFRTAALAKLVAAEAAMRPDVVVLEHVWMSW